MEIILPQNHILYNSSSDIKQICAPLKTYFDIPHFSFVKINPDLSRVHLDTNVAWNEYFYKKCHHYYSNSNLTEGTHWQTGYSLLHMLEDSECIADATNFDIGNGVVISNHVNGTTELAFFALSNNESDTKVTSLLNNIDALKNFIAYFKSTAEKLLNEADKAPIEMPFLVNDKINNFAIDTSAREKFLKCIDKAPLTKRERECIECLSKDMSIKEIAAFLKITPRTAKEHLANARVKVGCKKSASLIDIIK